MIQHFQPTDDTPQCPQCGCQAIHPDPARKPTWWHQQKTDDDEEDLPSKKITPHICDHCGERFTVTTEETIPAAVEYHRTRCPACRVAVTVETTRAPIRYHKCRNCGWRFKSIERQPDDDV